MGSFYPIRRGYAGLAVDSVMVGSDGGRAAFFVRGSDAGEQEQSHDDRRHGEGDRCGGLVPDRKGDGSDQQRRGEDAVNRQVESLGRCAPALVNEANPTSVSTRPMAPATTIAWTE